MGVGTRAVSPLVMVLVVLLAGCSGVDDGGELGAEPEVGAPQADAVTFTTEDGIDLNGFKFGSGDTAVVLAHMRGSNKDAWIDVAVGLARNGFMALPFDFRGYAGQKGRQDENLDIDLNAAIMDVRARGAENIFVVGASMGATAALTVAVNQGLEGVVAVSPSSQFDGLDAAAAVSNIEEPSLFIAARDDQPYASETEQLAEAAGGRLLLFDGDAHGTDLLDAHGDALTAAIIRFVQGPTSPPP